MVPVGTKSMARAQQRLKRYEAEASIKNIILPKTNYGIKVDVHAVGNGKTGSLTVGRGTIRWTDKGLQKPVSMNWERFSELMSTVRCLGWGTTMRALNKELE